jgi:hypothetical protein
MAEPPAPARKPQVRREGTIRRGGVSYGVLTQTDADAPRQSKSYYTNRRLFMLTRRAQRKGGRVDRGGGPPRGTIKSCLIAISGIIPIHGDHLDEWTPLEAEFDFLRPMRTRPPTKPPLIPSASSEIGEPGLLARGITFALLGAGRGRPRGGARSRRCCRRACR